LSPAVMLAAAAISFMLLGALLGENPEILNPHWT